MNPNRVRMPEWLALVDWGNQLLDLFDDDPWLVGSAANGNRDYTDVDVRVMLDDKKFEHWCGRPTSPYYDNPKWRHLCAAISAWGKQLTGLPIDFQIQRDCEAQVEYRHGARWPIASGRMDPVAEDVWQARRQRLEAELKEIMRKEREGSAMVVCNPDEHP